MTGGAATLARIAAISGARLELPHGRPVPRRATRDGAGARCVLQAARGGMGSGVGVEGCWGVGGGRAVAGRGLLWGRLEQRARARHALEGAGDIFAQLAQAVAATAGAGCRRFDHHPLARQVFWKIGAAPGALALKGRHSGGLGYGDLGGELICGGRGLKLFEL